MVPSRSERESAQPHRCLALPATERAFAAAVAAARVGYHRPNWTRRRHEPSGDASATPTVPGCGGAGVGDLCHAAAASVNVSATASASTASVMAMCALPARAQRPSSGHGPNGARGVLRCHRHRRHRHHHRHFHLYCHRPDCDCDQQRAQRSLAVQLIGSELRVTARA
jgi:hypothetical protein